MKKVVTIFIIILFALYPAMANSITVCSSCNVTSIAKAITIANSGDTLYIKAGTYFETDIQLNKPLTIIGQQAIIDADFKSSIFIISADSVSLINLTLNNVSSSFTKDHAAIVTFKINYFLFENLTFNQPFFAFLIQKSKHGIVRYNTINGNAKDEVSAGNGIHLWHCDDVKIYENTVTQMRDGIYFEFVSNSEIHDNYSKGNMRYGLHFMFSNNNVYHNNSFENNGAGVAVMFSKNIIMKNNLFKQNWGSASYGLLLKEIYDAEIFDNTFKQNTIGINAEGSTRINYKNNVFDNNGWAIKIAGACYNNVFIHNDFMNNAFDVSYNGGINENSFNNNYWSNYTGYDLDKDGIGDVPYRPVNLFSYIVNQTPEAIILLRSLFVDIVNFSEKVSPIFTPDKLKDEQPIMHLINNKG